MAGVTLPKPFVGNEHQSFFLPGGNHAALLLHGFPGTPAEMLPIGTVLKDAGWTVHGLMLPGLGAEIEKLDQFTSSDWSHAANRTFQQLRRHHPINLLVGYSLGGALALSVASEQRPAGLVLLAPFWNFAADWLNLSWPALRLFVRHFRPLQGANFAAPEVRRSLQRMFKNIDLENAQIQYALRRLTVSTKQIEQVRKLGQSAYSSVSRIDVPTLVLQGKRDAVVPPHRTRRLMKGFKSHVEYHELDAGHDIVDPQSGAWDLVKESLLRFAVARVEHSKSEARRS